MLVYLNNILQHIIAQFSYFVLKIAIYTMGELLLVLDTFLNNSIGTITSVLIEIGKKIIVQGNSNKC